LSLAIQGSRLVAVRRVATAPFEIPREPIMSKETLVAGGTGQQLLTNQYPLKWVLVQNVSTDTITLDKIADDPASVVKGSGIVLTKANSEGEGGGFFKFHNMNPSKWGWIGDTTGSIITVLRWN